MVTRYAPVAALLVTLLGGCAPPGEQGEVTVEEPTTAPTVPNATDDVSPDSPITKPAVNLATMPVGGDSQDLGDPADVVCATANWLWPPDQPAVPEGVTARVTGYAIEPQVFEVTSEDCGGPLCLENFAFTANDTACVVALRSLRPATDVDAGEDASLRLSGEATCPGGSCPFDPADLDGEITLTAPYVPTEAPSPTESPTETGTESPTTTDGPS